MNSKKSKALRRVIKNLEKNTPEITANFNPAHLYIENERNRKYVKITDIENGEVITKQLPVAAGTITVNPVSRRGMYLRLKRELAKQSS